MQPLTLKMQVLLCCQEVPVDCMHKICRHPQQRQRERIEAAALPPTPPSPHLLQCTHPTQAPPRPRTPHHGCDYSHSEIFLSFSAQLARSGLLSLPRARAPGCLLLNCNCNCTEITRRPCNRCLASPGWLLTGNRHAARCGH
jgi:hypothetical protein